MLREPGDGPCLWHVDRNVDAASIQHPSAALGALGAPALFDPIARERDAIKDIIASDAYAGETIYFWDKTSPNSSRIEIYEDGKFVLPSWDG